MNRQAFTRLVVLCVFLGLAPTGCSTTHPGVTNRMGTIEAYMTASPDEVVDATVKAAEQLMLKVESSAASKLDGRVDALTAQARKVRITTTNRGEGISLVTVRVGDWGDSSLSMVVLEKIRENLATKD